MAGIAGAAGPRAWRACERQRRILTPLVQTAARDVVLGATVAGQGDEPEVTGDVGVEGIRPGQLVVRVPGVNPEVVGPGQPCLPGPGRRADDRGLGAQGV